MSQEVARQDDFNRALADIENMQTMCQKLMKTPHYAKMGPEGIFAVMAKAKSMNVNPLDALNGGMYYVKGKVEMSGQMMLALIRQAGHSVTMDPKSTQTNVTMHGKRVDNGDTWTVSFSVDDAKKAGTYSDGGVWNKYPQVMCSWRCVSMLGRFLFSDVIKGCYVEGELSMAPALDSPVQVDLGDAEVIQKPLVTSRQILDLVKLLEYDPEYRGTVIKRLNDLGINSLEMMPVDLYDRVYSAAKKKIEEMQKQELETINTQTIEVNDGLV